MKRSIAPLRTLSYFPPSFVPFAETEVPRTDTGVIDDRVGFQSGTYTGHYEMVSVWSVGAPAGTPTTPFLPLSADQKTQKFREPTPGDSAQDSGLRYQSPNVDSTISSGFDLASLPSFVWDNRFTAFRFPDVPAGADNQFTLKVGATEIAGLAGETVNLRQYVPDGVTVLSLRQYVPDGVTVLSLRGDLSPFLPTAAMLDGAAFPIGGDPPPLTFGLAFAQPGIASFTLKPVPEPATVVLAMLG